MTGVSRQLLNLFSTLCFVIARVTPTVIAQTEPLHSPNMFNPQSTPAHSIFDLSIMVLKVTGVIFVVVVTLLIYAILKYRKRAEHNDHEPPQVFGSNQIELAWTVLPILVVLILFFSTARVIHAIQDANMPPNALEVVAVGHQFWWEFRYPKLGIVTANELRWLLGSFLYGSMANALPQAIGAQAAATGRQVVTLSGDGGIAMLLGDLLTLRQLNLPVKVVVFNNGALGFVELEMKAAGWVSYGTDLVKSQLRQAGGVRRHKGNSSGSAGRSSAGFTNCI